MANEFPSSAFSSIKKEKKTANDQDNAGNSESVENIPSDEDFLIDALYEEQTREDEQSLLEFTATSFRSASERRDDPGTR